MVYVTYIFTYMHTLTTWAKTYHITLAHDWLPKINFISNFMIQLLMVLFYCRRIVTCWVALALLQMKLTDTHSAVASEIDLVDITGWLLLNCHPITYFTTGRSSWRLRFFVYCLCFFLSSSLMLWRSLMKIPILH